MLHKAKRHRFRIGLTPLIDMVFLLVIFFMLTTTFTKHEAVELNFGTLSSAKTSEGKHHNIIVKAKQDGVLLLNGVAMDYRAFRRNLRQLLREHPDANVFLQSGYGATVQDMLIATDQVHLAGIRQLTFDTPLSCAAPKEQP